MLTYDTRHSVGLRVMLGILSFTPLLALVAMAAIPGLREAGDTAIGVSGPGPTFPWSIFITLMTLLLLIFHMHFLYTNQRVGTFGRYSWTLLLVFFNVLALPAHWYLYIWRSPPRPVGGSASNMRLDRDEHAT